MIEFHAVMIDETGCEFGVAIEATDRQTAYEQLQEDWPESRCVQLETRQDQYKREREMYEHIERGGDWDEDGRPIYHYSYDDEEDEEDE
jgi:hypothetical protein